MMLQTVFVLSSCCLRVSITLSLPLSLSLSRSHILSQKVLQTLNEAHRGAVCAFGPWLINLNFQVLDFILLATCIFLGVQLQMESDGNLELGAQIACQSNNKHNLLCTFLSTANLVEGQWLTYDYNGNNL